MMEFYKTINKAFDMTKDVISEAKGKIVFGAYGRSVNINTSSILTTLIQDTGRFVENYASDLFITWKSVEALLESDTTKPGRYIISFGMYDCGVDSNNFVIRKLEGSDHGSGFINAHRAGYRRVLAVSIELDEDNYITMQLKNITSAFLHMDEADKRLLAG